MFLHLFSSVLIWEFFMVYFGKLQHFFRFLLLFIILFTFWWLAIVQTEKEIYFINFLIFISFLRSLFNLLLVFNSFFLFLQHLKLFFFLLNLFFFMHILFMIRFLYLLLFLFILFLRLLFNLFLFLLLPLLLLIIMQLLLKFLKFLLFPGRMIKITGITLPTEPIHIELTLLSILLQMNKGTIVLPAWSPLKIPTYFSPLHWWSIKQKYNSFIQIVWLCQSECNSDQLQALLFFFQVNLLKGGVATGITSWSYGVMVSTLDSESNNPSSNLGRTSFFFPPFSHLHTALSFLPPLPSLLGLPIYTSIFYWVC